MNKAGIILIVIWVLLALTHIVGLFVGLNLFFMIANDIFGILNGFICIAMVPMIVQAIKDYKRAKK